MEEDLTVVPQGQGTSDPPIVGGPESDICRERRAIQVTAVQWATVTSTGEIRGGGRRRPGGDEDCGGGQMPAGEKYRGPLGIREEYFKG